MQRLSELPLRRQSGHCGARRARQGVHIVHQGTAPSAYPALPRHSRITLSCTILTEESSHAPVDRIARRSLQNRGTNSLLSHLGGLCAIK